MLGWVSTVKEISMSASDTPAILEGPHCKMI